MIPEVRLVDLQEHLVRAYTQLTQTSYHIIRQLHAGQTLIAATIAGLEVSVNDILG